MIVTPTLVRLVVAVADKMHDLYTKEELIAMGSEAYYAEVADTVNELLKQSNGTNTSREGKAETDQARD
jgi:hypothetical protein